MNLIRKLTLGALAGLCALIGTAHAGWQYVDPTGNVTLSAPPAVLLCSTTGNAAAPCGGTIPLGVFVPGAKPLSVQFTRPANTTSYSAGQAVCTSTSSDCTPLAFPAGRIVGGTGLVHGVSLIKSGTSTTNATFTIQLYQGAPTVTGIHDGSTYSPTFTDVTSGAYRGYATCSTAVVNGDNAHYSCTLNNPAGTMAFRSDNAGKIYAVIQATGAYTPASGEKFQVNLSVLQD